MTNLLNLIMCSLLVTSTSFAGGDSHSSPRLPHLYRDCFSNDGSRHPCAASSGPRRKLITRSACVSILPYVAELTCERSSGLVSPFSGSVSSSLELIKAQWIQNPQFNEEKCLLVGQSGYYVNYSISEANRVFSSSDGTTVNITDSPYFAGLTDHNRVAFKAYDFSGLGSFVRSGSAIVCVQSDDSSSKTNGFFEGSILSFKSGRVALSGKALSVGLNLGGTFQDLTFDCR